MLIKVISSEQFGFLSHRQILDVVGATQEGIHSIKTKHLPACLLKIDLIKAYDRIDWVYLRLLLLHIGLDIELASWIMACAHNLHFTVLVNGSPTVFFNGGRGLRQGCPLSPLLFILVMDGLCRLIGKARDDGTIQGVQVSNTFALTHILFVDDVLLFGSNNIGEWTQYRGILSLFCTATRMEISGNKSCFMAPGGHMDTNILEIFPYQMHKIEDGFWYLGFTLKPNGYNKIDWSWLLDWVKSKIGLWCYR